MLVTRVEHNCPGLHGPFNFEGCDSPYTDDVPSYGSNGNPPTFDGIMDFIPKIHIIGTLPEQFNRWWGYNSGSRQLSERWAVKLFDVPKSKLLIGGSQVAFRRSDANLITSTQDASDTGIANMITKCMIRKSRTWKKETIMNSKERWVNTDTSIKREAKVVVNTEELMDVIGMQQERIDTVAIVLQFPNGRNRTVRVPIDMLSIPSSDPWLSPESPF